jgi:hypothetical protein
MKKNCSNFLSLNIILISYVLKYIFFRGSRSNIQALRDVITVSTGNGYRCSDGK